VLARVALTLWLVATSGTAATVVVHVSGAHVSPALAAYLFGVYMPVRAVAAGLGLG
jgi:hypothetical protein